MQKLMDGLNIKEQNTFYICGLPNKICVRLLYETYKVYGKIVYIKLLKLSQLYCMNNNLAFITFQNVCDAEQAILDKRILEDNCASGWYTDTFKHRKAMPYFVPLGSIIKPEL
ncbi:hypothetical protein A3Q56_05642 [Intoshia linei]|uniref:RRM domain-containing protein n=1 Tax=Intoshia linei TaxID=1819745 RepID=A0A177AXM7_9BILA|nr:hypothetical protein A3Q56_05642 [Intoshia linei]